MSMSFFILAIISALCGTALMVMIASSLSKRGIKINYVFLRLYILKYIHQYRNSSWHYYTVGGAKLTCLSTNDLVKCILPTLLHHFAQNFLI